VTGQASPVHTCGYEFKKARMGYVKSAQNADIEAESVGFDDGPAEETGGER